MIDAMVRQKTSNYWREEIGNRNRARRFGGKKSAIEKSIRQFGGKNSMLPTVELANANMQYTQYATSCCVKGERHDRNSVVLVEF